MRNARDDSGRAAAVDTPGDCRCHGVEDGAQVTGAHSRATLAAARASAGPASVCGKDLEDLAADRTNCTCRPRLLVERATALGRVQDEDACRGVLVRRDRAVGPAAGDREEHG